MSGSKPQVTTTSAESAPWAAQQPFLTKGFDAAGKALDSLPSTTYQGPAIAPIGAGQTSSAQGQFDLGTALKAQGFGQNFLTMANATANGDYLDPTKNTALMAAVDSSNNSVSKWLTDSALPAVRDSSIQSGYYGGSRQGVAQANAIETARTGAQDNANALIYGNYQTERANQINAANLLTQGAQLVNTPNAMQNEAATTLQGYDQAGLDKILGDQSYSFQAPYLGLQDYMSLINGNYGGTSTGTSSTPGDSTGAGLLKGILGGGATGAGLAKTFMSSANPMNLLSYGGAGAGLGVLSGLLG